MSWTFLKAFFKNEPVKIILFSTFTTIISIVALRYAVLENAITSVHLINVEILILSLIIFFVSGVLWFFSATFGNMLIPKNIRDFSNLEEYLERFFKGTPTFNGINSDNKFDWETEQPKLIKQWNDEDKVSIVSGGVVLAPLMISLFLFVLALYLFFLSVHVFVHQSLQTLFQ